MSNAPRQDVDALPLKRATLKKNAYAIVIGVEGYRQNLPKADFALNDARLVSEYLIKVMGYPEENVVTLANEHAALGDFVKYFKDGSEAMLKKAVRSLYIILATVPRIPKRRMPILSLTTVIHLLSPKQVILLLASTNPSPG